MKMNNWEYSVSLLKGEKDSPERVSTKFFNRFDLRGARKKFEESSFAKKTEPSVRKFVNFAVPKMRKLRDFFIDPVSEKKAVLEIRETGKKIRRLLGLEKGFGGEMNSWFDAGLDPWGQSATLLKSEGDKPSSALGKFVGYHKEAAKKLREIGAGPLKRDTIIPFNEKKEKELLDKYREEFRKDTKGIKEWFSGVGGKIKDLFTSDEPVEKKTQKPKKPQVRKFNYGTLPKEFTSALGSGDLTGASKIIADSRSKGHNVSVMQRMLSQKKPLIKLQKKTLERMPKKAPDLPKWEQWILENITPDEDTNVKLAERAAPSMEAIAPGSGEALKRRMKKLRSEGIAHKEKLKSDEQQKKHAKDVKDIYGEGFGTPVGKKDKSLIDRLTEGPKRHFKKVKQELDRQERVYQESLKQNK